MAIKAVELVTAGPGISVGDLVRIDAKARGQYLYGQVKGFKFLKGKAGVGPALPSAPLLGAKIDKVVVTQKISPLAKSDYGPDKEFELKDLTKIEDRDLSAEIEDFRVKTDFYKKRGVIVA